MDLKKAYATDRVKELEGVKMELGEGSWIKIARRNNPVYEKAWTDLSKPYAGQIRRGTLGDKAMTELLIKAMARGMVTGWKNIEYDGKKLAFNEKNVIMVLTELPDLREEVLAFSDNLENYKAMLDEDSEKNSGKS